MTFGVRWVVCGNGSRSLIMVSRKSSMSFMVLWKLVTMFWKYFRKASLAILFVLIICKTTVIEPLLAMLSGCGCDDDSCMIGKRECRS